MSVHSMRMILLRVVEMVVMGGSLKILIIFYILLLLKFILHDVIVNT